MDRPSWQEGGPGFRTCWEPPARKAEDPGAQQAGDMNHPGRMCAAGLRGRIWQKLPPAFQPQFPRLGGAQTPSGRPSSWEETVPSKARSACAHALTQVASPSCSAHPLGLTASPLHLTSGFGPRLALVSELHTQPGSGGALSQPFQGTVRLGFARMWEFSP